MKYLLFVGCWGLMMIDNLTIKQKMVLECIEVFINDKGYSPTYREIASLVGILPSSAFQIVMKLQDKGFVDYELGKQRTIRVIKHDGR